MHSRTSLRRELGKDRERERESLSQERVPSSLEIVSEYPNSSSAHSVKIQRNPKKLPTEVPTEKNPTRRRVSPLASSSEKSSAGPCAATCDPTDASQRVVFYVRISRVSRECFHSLSDLVTMDEPSAAWTATTRARSSSLSRDLVTKPRTPGLSQNSKKSRVRVQIESVGVTLSRGGRRAAWVQTGPRRQRAAVPVQGRRDLRAASFHNTGCVSRALAHEKSFQETAFRKARSKLFSSRWVFISFQTARRSRTHVG